MKTYSRIILTALLAATMLSGCESARDELGLTRSSPDEFAVVKRAPLEMPPEFALRPPQPGAPRPQEQAVAEQARNAVLGTTKGNSAQGRGEEALLANADARYNPDIRDIVNQEAAQTVRKNEPVVKKLLNIGKDQAPAATIVDSAAEAQRLKNNAEQGRPVTDGETPTLED